MQQFTFLVVIGILMFAPTRQHFYKIYSVIVVILPVLLIDLGKINLKWKQLLLLTSWSIFFLLSTCLREAFLTSSQLARELLEVSRILIFIPILLIRDIYTGREARKLLNTLIYSLVLLNSFMVLTEIRLIPKNGIYYTIQGIYHYDVQIGLSYLAKGMYSHGALQSLMMLVYSIYLTCTYSESKVKFFRLIIIFLSIFCLFAGGSRTVMIGFAIYLSLYFGFGLLRRRGKPSAALWSIPTISLLGLGYLIQAGYFVKLLLLLQDGTNVTSVAARQDNWTVFIEKINYYWYFSPIGWGKTMFINKKSFFTDNDYFTYFLVHGIIVAGILVFYIIKESVSYLSRFRHVNSLGFGYMILLYALIIVSTNSAGFSFPFALFMLIYIKQMSLRDSSLTKLSLQDFNTKPTTDTT